MVGVLCAAQAAPQQTSDPHSSVPPQSQPDDRNKSAQDKNGQDPNTSTSKDRLFFALPNFLTLENGSNVPPLTAGQKFKVEARSSFDYVQIPWYGLLAGVGQADNSEPGYGQGAQGYGKRFASAAADGTIENFMTGAILPSLLREDPRFFQMGEGRFWRRAGYSASRIVVTRTDSGHQQFNFSEVFGSALSAGISTYSYHPKADRTVSNSAGVWGSQVAVDAMTIVLKEFWPDIRRTLKKKTGN